MNGAVFPAPWKSLARGGRSCQTVDRVVRSFGSESSASPSLVSQLDSALHNAAALIEEAPILTLACHAHPDGDALGSMLALAHLARAQGRTVVASWPNPFVAGENYRSLPGLESCVSSDSVDDAPAVMVTFDCGSMDRLGELAVPATDALRRGHLIVVDHHATNCGFGSVNVVDPSAAASAVVVRQLANVLGWPLNRDSAYCLYAALVADTGHFQHGNTDAGVFELARELASFGLPIAELSRQLSGQHRFAYIQLAAAVLSLAVLDTDVGLVSAVITRADRERFNVSYTEAEGLIEWLRTTSEASVAAVCKETDAGYRVSLRSVDAPGSIDVAAIAQSFGGGGHRLAAGFLMKAPLASVLAAVRHCVVSARTTQVTPAT